MTAIKTETQYEAAMERINELLLVVTDDTPESMESIELDLLSGLVEDYESVQYPIEKPSLISVIKLRMFEMGLTQKGLAQLLGMTASKISEILSGKREPTLQNVRDLCVKLLIDPAVALGI